MESMAESIASSWPVLTGIGTLGLFVLARIWAGRIERRVADAAKLAADQVIVELSARIDGVRARAIANTAHLDRVDADIAGRK